tara:strand:- start:431 stop:844 length:414 start_codon:yes stop_codon:yes gene_type:complete
MAVRFTRKIDFPMVDLAGIVYYPVYWDLAHRFFEQFWEENCSINYPKMIQELGIGFPVVKNECDFLAPLRYGDTVNCKLWISEIGTKSCTWKYAYTNQDNMELWNATVVTVCANLNTLESIAIPQKLYDALESCSHD